MADWSLPCLPHNPGAQCFFRLLWLTSFFFTEGTEEYPADLLVPRKTEPASVLEGLDRTREILAGADFEDEAGMEAALRALADELGLKAGQLFMPIRIDTPCGQ